MQREELKMEEEKQYFDYITKHIDNVKESFKVNGMRIGHLLGLSVEDFETLGHNVEKHDESKFSEEEFEPYRQYFYPTKDEVKNADKFTEGWIHHFQNNPHHPEYWVRNGTTEEMSKVYIAEMILDWEAMSRNFGGNPLKWYKENRDRIPLNEKTRFIVKAVLTRVYHEDDNLKFK